MLQDQKALTVTQLNRQIRTWLELEIGEVAVIGELSNLSKPTSGHYYFTLKDKTAQVRCVYFRNNHTAKSINFSEGQQVIAQGRLSLYEARGDYQLIVYRLTEAGFGELYLQFEQLKMKLKAQGLFEIERKKPIPLYPNIIAVITSATGAAIRDILTTLANRYPLAKVKIYASEVQGNDAAWQLVRAIQQANHDEQAEVIILARGGGSIEDLWAFNDEQLALTMSQSRIPIVSGIGHETDFTIADFVADLRAATPTAAAQAATPDQMELRRSITAYKDRIVVCIHRCIKHLQLLLDHRIAKLLSPSQQISKHWQAIDYLERQLHQNCFMQWRKKENKLHLFLSRLNAKNPLALLQEAKAKLNHLEQQLLRLITLFLQRLKQRYTRQLATLHAVSPLATLERGYAIATYHQKVLFETNEVQQGETIEVRLAKGILLCEVIDKKS